MGWFIFAIILWVVAIGLAIGAVAVKGSGDRDVKGSGPGLLAGAVAAFLVGFLLLFLGGFREVPVHSVGVATSFGKVEGDLRPGVHVFVAPWTQVHVLDETIQTSTFRSTSWPGGKGNCMPVRIGGQQLACANVVLKWQIEDPAAPVLFNNYDNQGTTVQASITRNLVLNDLYSVANKVFGGYNPVEDEQLTAQTTGKVAQDQYSTFGPEILSQMRADLQGQIKILALNLSNPFYNQATETRLASVANQFADTAAADQQVQTDLALARANKDLSKSLTPQLVQYQCITSTSDIIKSGGHMPAGWNCFGGSSVAVGSGG